MVKNERDTEAGRAGNDQRSPRPATAKNPQSTWLRTLKRYWRPVMHWAIVGAAVGYLAYVAPGFAHDLHTATTSLDHLHWEWMWVAVLCGISALVLYGEMHRQLLRAGGAQVPGRTVQGINFVENAVSTTVPVVGGAGAIAYAIDQLRRRGVDSALASWSVLVAGVVATLTLVVLGALGLGVTGRMPIVVALSVAALVAIGSVGAWKVVTHPAVLRYVVRWLVLVGRWIPGICKTCKTAWTAHADQVSDRVSARVAVLQPGGIRWLVVIVLAALTWAFDYSTLAASIAAVNAPVPWGVLLVGFLLVQGSIALQIFPGGAGLAETSLLTLLLASGIATAPATAGVLIYRSISWLGLSLLGWALYALWIHTAPIHLHRHAPELSQA